MLKTLRKLFLRGAKSVGKSGQRQARSLLRILLAPAPPKRPARARAAKKPASAVRQQGQAARPIVPADKPAPARTARAPQATPRTPVAAGKWLSGIHREAAAGTAAALHYHLYLPRSSGPPQNGAGTRPLLVMLHGCEQSAAEFARGTRMNQLAEKKGWAVLYPQQSAHGHPNRCWKWYDAATQAGGGDTAHIAALIEAIAGAHAIDRSRIYLCGISAGAAMAHIIALNHPHLVAAVGLHSAPVFGAGRSPLGAYRVMQHGDRQRMHGAIREILDKSPHFPALPTILIQGDDDTVVRPVNQAQLEQQSLQLNEALIDRSTPAVARAARTRRALAYSVRDFYQKKKPLLRVVHIAGLAHAWSGGDPSLPYHNGAGPDAGKLMLAFFARHRRLADAATRVRARAPEKKAVGDYGVR